MASAFAAPRRLIRGILLVGDSHAAVATLRTILDEPDHEVVEARSAEAALDRLNNQTFAVIVVEVRRVDLRGFDTAAQIRNDERARQTPILFFSADALEQTHIEAGYRLGAVDFLLEPLAPLVVRAKIRNLVELFQQKEQARQEAEQLRLIVQGTTDYAIFMLDPEGRIVTWNAGAERLKGYSADDIIGQHFSRFYPRQVIERGWPAYELKVAAEKGRFEDEGWRLRKDGTRFWANVVISALRDERGELRGFSKVTRDLTERKQAEESLRRSEERFRLIVESAKDYAIFVLDPQGHVASWNPGAERIKGYTADEIIGQHFSKFYPREALDRGWPAHELKVAAAEGRFEDEGWRVRKDGSTFWANVIITALKNEQGELLGFSKITRDLTARKQAEENARRLAEEVAARKIAHEERARLRVTLASIGDAVISTDAEGIIDFLNPIAEELCGWTAADAVGRKLGNVFRIVNEETRAPVENPALRALLDGKIVGLANHTLLIAKDGFERPIDDSGAPIKNDRGEVIGSVLVFRDISERRRNQAALREQTDNAETLLRVGRLLAQELDVERIVQIVTDEATRLCGAEFGAFFYNVISERGEAYTLYTLSGVPREAFERFPMPRNTPVFSPTFRGEGVVRLDDVTQDPRYGKMAPHFGMPEGHLPVKSYLAVPVVSRSGEVLGGLFFGHSKAGVFSVRAEQLLTGIAGQAAVAIDNGRLHQRTQAAAERLNLALHAADLGDWSWDAASDVVTFSERAAEIFGIPPGPHLTWTAMQGLLHEDDRGRAKQEVDRVVAERAQYDIEYRVNRPDGLQVWVGVLGRAMYDADQVVGMYGVVQDVSERKRLEESLRRSEARFRALMEQAPFSIQVFSPEGRTVQVNRAWEELWGVTLDQIEGYNILEDRQLEAKGVLPLIHKAFAGESAFIPAICYDPNETIPDQTRHDDPARWVAAVAYPLKDSSGQIGEVVLVHDDITARRRAEIALLESEERLRLLADTIPQLAWMARPDGNIFWYNRRWYEYTGTTPEQMEGWGWQSVHDPEVLPEVVERWKYSLSTGKPFDMVFPLRGADGALRPFLTRVNPLVSDGGRVLYWFGTNTDITELRQAREALGVSEERLRLALEAGRMGVWDWNVRTGELNWSDSLEPLHGLERGTFGGTFLHFQELIHPDDRDAVNAAIRQALDSSGEFHVEFRSLRQNGGVHWIAGSGKVFPGADGKPLRMIGIGLDVTARKRSEQTARFLADASAALALLVDFDSTLQKVASLAVPHFADWASVDVLDNGSLRRVAVAHMDPAKVQLAHDVHRRFPPDPSAPTGVWNILRTSQAEIVPEVTDEMLVAAVKEQELLGIMRELGLRSYIGVPLTVRGKTIGVLTFISAESDHLYDQTDLDAAKDLASRAGIAVENTQLYRELREADRRKDEFLATLAHELRNPLAPIRNGLQILRLTGGSGQNAEETRSMMERQLGHLVRLVDDLLDVSRITRNKLELRRERVALAAVLHSAIDTSRPLIEEFGHTFSITLTPTPVFFDADPVRLAQVFANLLNNAAKYTMPGGTITLTAETQGADAVIRVRDDGLGIPLDAQLHIFEMFSQLDRNVERAQGGLGIGLTLVRRLVEMHGGTVAVRSDGPGTGSEFTVRIPILKDAQADAHGSATVPEVATGAKRRILVVDDNQDSAESLGMMLTLMGNDVHTAGDGIAAIEAARDFKPDVILLDIGLPRLNGYDACRRIREQTWSKDMTIVALTGWGQEEDRRRSHEAGFDHHLVKPVELAALQRLLADHEQGPLRSA